jgi:protein TonB
MLAYAANRPIIAGRPKSPATLALVIGLHAALIALAISARMEFAPPRHDPPIKVEIIPPAPVPPPNPTTNHTRPQPTETHIDHTTSIVKTNTTTVPVTLGDAAVQPGPVAGLNNIPSPIPIPRPTVIARTEATLITPEWDLKPPYPMAKIASEEEAVLKLRLTIDERGRVVAVEPLGPADRAFLDSARRHLLSHWRYKPAMEDGRPVASSIVVRLRFTLDG